MTMQLSAAQPRPNAPLVTPPLVGGMPLCRAALSGATWSTAEMSWLGYVTEQFEGKSPERSDNLR